MKIMLAPNWGKETPKRVECNIPYNISQPISIKKYAELRMWSYVSKVFFLDKVVSSGSVIVGDNNNLQFRQWKIIDALFFCRNLNLDLANHNIMTKYYLVKTLNLIYLVHEGDIIQN